MPQQSRVMYISEIYQFSTAIVSRFTNISSNYNIFFLNRVNKSDSAIDIQRENLYEDMIRTFK